MNNSIRFVPFSVKMRSAGLVRNPIRSWSLSVPQWIPAPIKIDMVAVDRTVDVLSRFVARWVAQSRTARREYAVREASERWTREAWTPAWSKVMEMEDEKETILARIRFEAWCSMPEANWNRIARNMTAAVRDVGILARDVLKPVYTERDRRAALVSSKVVQTAQVWKEVVRPVQRRTNRFSTGSDSE
jgi:hypothetical protein